MNDQRLRRTLLYVPGNMPSMLQNIPVFASDGSAVNIDQEMAHLLSLQNSYAANARVLTTVKEMLDALLRI